MLDAILGSECSNNGLESYMHMTIQYKISLKKDKMKIKIHKYCTLYSFLCKILFGGHLGCHVYFLLEIILGAISNVCFTAKYGK